MHTNTAFKLRLLCGTHAVVASTSTEAKWDGERLQNQWRLTGLRANEPDFYGKRGKEDCDSGDKVMGAGHHEGSPGTLAGTVCCCGVVVLAPPFS